MSLILLSILYSLKPFSFKDRPFLDLITNAIGYGFLVFTIGYGSVSKESLIFVLIMACAYLMTAILDYEGDSKTNKITTVVHLGIFSSHVIAILGLLVVFFIAQYNYIKFSALLSLILLSFNEIKLSLAIPSLILLIYPSISGYYPILVISVVIFIFSEIYYRIVFKRSHFKISA